MSTPLRVSVTPADIRVPVGATAVFTCHTNLMFAERVQKFSWEAAVQIANETRYSFKDNSRIVSINDVQEKDHNTDVTCRVLTSRGRRGKAGAKLFVDAVGEEHHWDPLTVRPQLPGTAQPESVASPVIGMKNAFLLGTVLGVVGFFAIVMIGLKLYGYSVAKRVASGVIGESILLRRNLRVRQYEWSRKTVNNAGPVPEPSTQTYAELGETCANIYEDLKLPGLGLRPGCTNSLPPCVEFYKPRSTSGGTSDLRTYENFTWVLSSDQFDQNHRSARWDRPGCSLSLPTHCVPPPSGLATTSTHTGMSHTDSSADITEDCRLTPLGNSYENIIDVLSQPEYENQRTESFSSDVTYADLDFGSGFESSPSPSSTSPSPSSSSIVEQTGVDPTEYSKVQKVLSVYRSRSGSTRVTVEVINK